MTPPELVCSNSEARAALGKVLGRSFPKIPEGSLEVVRDAWYRDLNVLGIKGVSAELEGPPGVALLIELLSLKEPGISKVVCRAVFYQKEGYSETMIKLYRFWPNDWGTGDAIAWMKRYLGK